MHNKFFYLQLIITLTFLSFINIPDALASKASGVFKLTSSKVSLHTASRNHASLIISRVPEKFSHAQSYNKKMLLNYKTYRNYFSKTTRPSFNIHKSIRTYSTYTGLSIGKAYFFSYSLR